MQKQVNPVYRQRGKDDCSRVFPRPIGAKSNPQTRRSRHQNASRIRVEDRKSQQAGEHERVPVPGGEKSSVEELDGAPCRAARDTGKTGKIVKCAARPGQSQKEPRDGARKTAQRNRQPNQLIIEFTRSKMPTRKLHQFVLNDAIRSRRQATQTSSPAQTRRRSKRSGEATPRGRHDRCPFRALVPARCNKGQFSKLRQRGLHRRESPAKD
jgi:hypothetical protein